MTLSYFILYCMYVVRQACVQPFVSRVSKAETLIESHENRLKLLEYKSIDIESRSRRRNLIFWDITESPDDVKDSSMPFKFYLC